MQVLGAFRSERNKTISSGSRPWWQGQLGYQGSGPSLRGLVKLRSIIGGSNSTKGSARAYGRIFGPDSESGQNVLRGTKGALFITADVRNLKPL